MQIDSQPQVSPETETAKQQPSQVIALPALPSFALADADNTIDFEVQAEHLLNYINKLTSLADRACSTAIRQSESAQRMEENRQTEINFLRRQLEQANGHFREQHLSMTRLEQNSRERIETLEGQLRQKEIFRIQREKEFIHLRSEYDALLNRQPQTTLTAQSAEIHEVRLKQELEPLHRELDELKLQIANRDETIQTKSREVKAMELEFRAKIVDLEQRLRDGQNELQILEAKLKEKDALLQATAEKETEIGNLIKRLSSECETLNGELREKSQVLAQMESKKGQSAGDGKIWRKVIGRLQDDL
jgi:chromosome segregation ATPase